MLPKDIYEKRWVVVGLTFEDACIAMNHIEETCGKQIQNRIRDNYFMCTEFTDGTTLRWFSAKDNCCSQRCGKMWCDAHIDPYIFKNIVLRMYFGKIEDIIWIT